MATDDEIDKAIELILLLRGDQRERAWDRLLSRVPKGIYVAISGRQVKTLQEQADTYKLPLKGERIDFRSLAKAFHDFLAENAQLLSASPEKLEKAQLETKLMRYKVRDAEFEQAQRENKYIDRAEVSAVLGKLCFWLRGLGERLGRRHGPEIQRSINEQIEQVANDLEGLT